MIENEALMEIIEAVFHEHQGRYGARRIQAVLAQRNIHINVKRVSRLMSGHGLVPRGTGKRIVTARTKCNMKDMTTS